MKASSRCSPWLLSSSSSSSSSHNLSSWPLPLYFQSLSDHTKFFIFPKSLSIRIVAWAARPEILNVLRAPPSDGKFFESYGVASRRPGISRGNLKQIVGRWQVYVHEMLASQGFTRNDNKYDLNRDIS
jgi:hypothetical protein